MDCRDTRWNLNAFLNGNLEVTDSEAVREHLDHCAECVAYLADSHKIDQIETPAESVLSVDFTKRVVSEIPEVDQGSILTRYFFTTVGAALAIAITTFAFVRYYLQASNLPEIPGKLPEGGTLSQFFPFLRDTLSTPTTQYLLFSLAAIGVSISLIFLVDLIGQLGRGEKSSTRISVNNPR